MATSKAAYQTACVAKWMEWKKTGKEPKERFNAMIAVQSALSKAGYGLLQLSKIKAGLAQTIELESGATELNPSLSFILWDLTENDGLAMDYGQETNWFNGLLQQARILVYTCTRAVVETSQGRIRMATIKGRTNGLGIQLIKDIPKARLNEMINDLISDTKSRIAGLKAIGADWISVRRALKKLNEEALALYDKTSKAAKKPAKKMPKVSAGVLAKAKTGMDVAVQ